MRFNTFITMGLLLWVAPVAAADVDPMIEGAKQCTRHLSRYERQYGIPTHLLSAISSTESGRYHAGLKITLPWPWTINVAGKGYYFDSKEEAINAVRKYQMQGINSIDVGCMQVNLHHHAGAFASLDDAFDPEHNVAYAASFLRTLYEESHSWKDASGDYHSKTPERGNQYVGLVYDKWTNIVNRLREARANLGDTTQLASNDDVMRGDVARPVELIAAEPKIIKVIPKVSPLPEQKGERVAAYKPAHMNSITVSSSGSQTATRERDNGVLVIRPDIKVVDATAPATITVAQTTPVSAIGSESHIIHVDDSKAPVVTKGPRFIFDN